MESVELLDREQVIDWIEFQIKSLEYEKASFGSEFPMSDAYDNYIAMKSILNII